MRFMSQNYSEDSGQDCDCKNKKTIQPKNKPEKTSISPIKPGTITIHGKDKIHKTKLKTAVPRFLVSGVAGMGEYATRATAGIMKEVEQVGHLVC